MEGLKQLLPKASGEDFISLENLGRLLASPFPALLLAGMLLITAYYVYFEIAALIIYCEAGWQGEFISLWKLWKNTFIRSLSMFHYKNLPVILLLLPVIAFSSLPLTDGQLRKARIPEFILEYILDSPLFSAAFAVLIILLNVLLFFYLFQFPGVILHGKYLTGSLSCGIRALQGKKLRTGLRLLVCGAAYAFFALLVFSGIVLFLWLRSKWPPSPDKGIDAFRFHYLKWSLFGTALLRIFGLLTLYSAVTVLHHQNQGELRPQTKPPKRTLRTVLRRTAAIAAALALLGLYSETELGGNLYFPASAGTAVVAHRAGAALAPENTLSALEASIRSGADIAEIDVRQTRDGQLIILHDSGFKRVAGVGRKVWETDYDTVRTLDAGSWFSPSFAGERIPTLSEMLAAADGRIRLMIELKPTDYDRNLTVEAVKQIRASGMETQCMLASMNLDILRTCRRLAPEIETVYITAVLVSDFRELDYVDGYSVETSFLTAGMMSQAHAEGKKVYAWTANKPRNMKKILRLEADGLITDNTELARYYLYNADENLLLQALTELLY